MYSEMMDGRMIHQYLMVVEPQKKRWELEILNDLGCKGNKGIPNKNLPIEIRLSLLFLRKKIVNENNENTFFYDKNNISKHIYKYNDIKLFIIKEINVVSNEEIYAALNSAFTIINSTCFDFFIELSTHVVQLSYKVNNINDSLGSIHLINITSYNSLELAEKILELSLNNWFDFHVLSWNISEKNYPDTKMDLKFIRECWISCVLYFFYERLICNEKTPQDILLLKREQLLNKLQKVEDKLFKKLNALKHDHLKEMLQGYFPNEHRFDIYKGG